MSRDYNTDNQAFPCLKPSGYTHSNGSPEMEMVSGLTKREWFAGMALSGLCANGIKSDVIDDILAKRAYKMVDAMLKAGKEME